VLADFCGELQRNEERLRPERTDIPLAYIHLGPLAILAGLLVRRISLDKASLRNFVLWAVVVLLLLVLFIFWQPGSCSGAASHVAEAHEAKVPPGSRTTNLKLVEPQNFLVKPEVKKNAGRKTDAEYGRKNRKHLTEAEVHALMKAALANRHGKRDRLMIALAIPSRPAGRRAMRPEPVVVV
jgi:hypothetical protein